MVFILGFPKRKTFRKLSLLVRSFFLQAPKIIDLPAYADVHEDTVDETLLHTFTFSDEENEAIWCKGSWMIGQEGTGTPFIVKMISTTAGSSCGLNSTMYKYRQTQLLKGKAHKLYSLP